MEVGKQQGIGWFAPDRMELPPWADHDEWQERRRAMLARALNLRTVVAFLGSGCSAALGYPTWEDLTGRIIDGTLGALSSPQQPLDTDQKPNSDLDTLQRFKDVIEEAKAREGTEKSKRIDADRLTYMLGVCQKVFKKRNTQEAENEYLKLLQDKFQEATPTRFPEPGENPYLRILKLPLRRFITTNFDIEIEKALRKEHGIPASKFGLPGSGTGLEACELAFTQMDESCRRLARFVIARAQEADNMVFHCHGRFDAPDSMIMTEADYQDWYLNDDKPDKPGRAAFRRTIDLLFRSNPILFIGFGLRDADLLRPLRRFSAMDQKRKSSRPLFALLRLSDKNDKQQLDETDYLYERYGLHVIEYEDDAQDIVVNRNKLCEAITRLETEKRDWRKRWLYKPTIRRVQVDERPPEPYIHYPPAKMAGPELEFGKKRLERLIGRLRYAAEGGARVIALIGRGGTGKSWLARRLIDQMTKPDNAMSFKAFFFWSSYYSDDSLTGIDRALDYLDRDGRMDGSRHQRLARCLNRERYLLVFDGIERFLYPPDYFKVYSASPNTLFEGGEAYSWSTREFFKVISGESRSTVVLTSRLWPKLLHENDKILRIPIERFTTDDIVGVGPFTDDLFSNDQESRRTISKLCGLLDGHIHALVLVATLLLRKKEGLGDILRRLSDIPSDRRTSEMIGIALDILDEKHKKMALRLLERIAMFMSPVSDEVVNLCYELAKKVVVTEPGPGSDPQGRGALPSCDALIEDLCSVNLLNRVMPQVKDTGVYAYTVHPTVRAYVFRRVHRATTDALPNFTLPGFTAGTADVDPGSHESVEVVKAVFKDLYEQAEDAWKRSDGATARALCRNAFGILRSRMEANTIHRWGSYQDYSEFLVRLTDLTRRVSPALWEFAGRRDFDIFEHPEGPLYADELAWLYNEMGIGCYGEGTILDALPVWEQGYVINHVIDSIEEDGQYTIQAFCNLGAAYIEYGRLDRAEQYLRDGLKASYRLDDHDHVGRLTGYLALLQHLRGDLKQANQLYRAAFRHLRKERRNPRAESIFLRHHASLKIRLGDLKGAEVDIETSRALAEAARYPDLVAYARWARGYLYQEKEEFSKVAEEYDEVLKTARKKGIRKLEVDALVGLSRLALRLGDAEVARQRAMEALGIANELVLGLRQTSALITLGIATVRAGQQDRALGIAYLEQARRMANRQQYWLRGREAEQHLQELGQEYK